ncbi:MAG: hypothetical protein AAFX93_17760 [Verrucomicrobiota bacterium]
MFKNARLLFFCRLVCVIVIAVMLGLTVNGPMDGWINEKALGPLDSSNEAYLEESFEDASRLFLVLTAVKSVLAVVEGSEIGVGFGLELGDLVQGVYDYVDFAWQIVLWATMIIVMTRMTLELSQFLDQWLLVIALGSMLFYLVSAWFMPQRRAVARVLRDISFFSTILALAAYLVVPLAVAGGSMLSEEITEARVQEAETNITALKVELEKRFAAVEDADGFFGKAAKMSDATLTLTTFLSAQTKDLFWDVITISAAYLFDTIIFPLGLFLIMFWLTRILARYFFGLRRGQVFREDMDTLMARYWMKRERLDATEPPGPQPDEPR